MASILEHSSNLSSDDIGLTAKPLLPSLLKINNISVTGSTKNSNSKSTTLEVTIKDLNVDIEKRFMDTFKKEKQRQIIVYRSKEAS